MTTDDFLLLDDHKIWKCKKKLILNCARNATAMRDLRKLLFLTAPDFDVCVQLFNHARRPVEQLMWEVPDI